MMEEKEQSGIGRIFSLSLNQAISSKKTFPSPLDKTLMSFPTDITSGDATLITENVLEMIKKPVGVDCKAQKDEDSLPSGISVDPASVKAHGKCLTALKISVKLEDGLDAMHSTSNLHTPLYTHKTDCPRNRFPSKASESKAHEQSPKTECPRNRFSSKACEQSPKIDCPRNRFSSKACEQSPKIDCPRNQFSSKAREQSPKIDCPRNRFSSKACEQSPKIDCPRNRFSSKAREQSPKIDCPRNQFLSNAREQSPKIDCPKNRFSSKGCEQNPKTEYPRNRFSSKACEQSPKDCGVKETMSSVGRQRSGITELSEKTHPFDSEKEFSALQNLPCQKMQRIKNNPVTDKVPFHLKSPQNNSCGKQTGFRCTTNGKTDTKIHSGKNEFTQRFDSRSQSKDQTSEKCSKWMRGTVYYDASCRNEGSMTSTSRTQASSSRKEHGDWPSSQNVMTSTLRTPISSIQKEHRDSPSSQDVRTTTSRTQASSSHKEHGDWPSSHDVMTSTSRTPTSSRKEHRDSPSSQDVRTSTSRTPISSSSKEHRDWPSSQDVRTSTSRTPISSSSKEHRDWPSSQDVRTSTSRTQASNRKEHRDCHSSQDVRNCANSHKGQRCDNMHLAFEGSTRKTGDNIYNERRDTGGSEFKSSDTKQHCSSWKGFTNSHQARAGKKDNQKDADSFVTVGTSSSAYDRKTSHQWNSRSRRVKASFSNREGNGNGRNNDCYAGMNATKEKLPEKCNATKPNKNHISSKSFEDEIEERKMSVKEKGKGGQMKKSVVGVTKDRYRADCNTSVHKHEKGKLYSKLASVNSKTEETDLAPGAETDSDRTVVQSTISPQYFNDHVCDKKPPVNLAKARQACTWTRIRGNHRPKPLTTQIDPNKMGHMCRDNVQLDQKSVDKRVDDHQVGLTITQTITCNEEIESRKKLLQKNSSSSATMQNSQEIPKHKSQTTEVTRSHKLNVGGSTSSTSTLQKLNNCQNLLSKSSNQNLSIYSDLDHIQSGKEFNSLSIDVCNSLKEGDGNSEITRQSITGECLPDSSKSDSVEELPYQSCDEHLQSPKAKFSDDRRSNANGWESEVMDVPYATYIFTGSGDTAITNESRGKLFYNSRAIKEDCARKVLDKGACDGPAWDSCTTPFFVNGSCGTECFDRKQQESSTNSANLTVGTRRKDDYVKKLQEIGCQAFSVNATENSYSNNSLDIDLCRDGLDFIPDDSVIQTPLKQKYLNTRVAGCNNKLGTHCVHLKEPLNKSRCKNSLKFCQAECSPKGLIQGDEAAVLSREERSGQKTQYSVAESDHSGSIGNTLASLPSFGCKLSSKRTSRHRVASSFADFKTKQSAIRHGHGHKSKEEFCSKHQIRKGEHNISEGIRSTSCSHSSVCRFSDCENEVQQKSPYWTENKYRPQYGVSEKHENKFGHQTHIYRKRSGHNHHLPAVRKLSQSETKAKSDSYAFQCWRRHAMPGEYSKENWKRDVKKSATNPCHHNEALDESGPNLFHREQVTQTENSSDSFIKMASNKTENELDVSKYDLHQAQRKPVDSNRVKGCEMSETRNKMPSGLQSQKDNCPSHSDTTSHTHSEINLKSDNSYIEQQPRVLNDCDIDNPSEIDQKSLSTGVEDHDQVREVSQPDALDLSHSCYGDEDWHLACQSQQRLSAQSLDYPCHPQYSPEHYEMWEAAHYAYYEQWYYAWMAYSMAYCGYGFQDQGQEEGCSEEHQEQKQCFNSLCQQQQGQVLSWPRSPSFRHPVNTDSDVSDFEMSPVQEDASDTLQQNLNLVRTESKGGIQRHFLPSQNCDFPHRINSEQMETEMTLGSDVSEINSQVENECTGSVQNKKNFIRSCGTAECGDTRKVPINYHCSSGTSFSGDSSYNMTSNNSMKHFWGVPARYPHPQMFPGQRLPAFAGSYPWSPHFPPPFVPATVNPFRFPVPHGYPGCRLRPFSSDSQHGTNEINEKTSFEVNSDNEQSLYWRDKAYSPPMSNSSSPSVGSQQLSLPPPPSSPSHPCPPPQLPDCLTRKKAETASQETSSEANQLDSSLDTKEEYDASGSDLDEVEGVGMGQKRKATQKKTSFSQFVSAQRDRYLKMYSESGGSTQSSSSLSRKSGDSRNYAEKVAPWKQSGCSGLWQNLQQCRGVPKRSQGERSRRTCPPRLDSTSSTPSSSSSCSQKFAKRLPLLPTPPCTSYAQAVSLGAPWMGSHQKQALNSKDCYPMPGMSASGMMGDTESKCMDSLTSLPPTQGHVIEENATFKTGKKPLLDDTCTSTPVAKKGLGKSRSDKEVSSKWAIEAFYQPYQTSFIDTHCHLDFLFNRQPFSGSFTSYQEKHKNTFPANFEGCVAVFCKPNTFTSEDKWKPLVEEPKVWMAMGCHPKNAAQYSELAETGLREALKHKKTVALGEIGLDYSKNHGKNSAKQKEVFIRQIKIALEMKLPLVIHCREAEDDCLAILKEHVPADHKIHCHCFTQDYASALRWLSGFSNLFIGLTPLVTYKSAVSTHQVACQIPLNKLLLETDAPFFVPNAFHVKNVSLSHPGMALMVAISVARLRGVSVEHVLSHARQNTRDMYGI